MPFSTPIWCTVQSLLVEASEQHLSVIQAHGRAAHNLLAFISAQRLQDDAAFRPIAGVLGAGATVSLSLAAPVMEIRD